MISVSADFEIPTVKLLEVPDSWKQDIMESTVEGINKRIGQDHQDGNGDYLEPNREGWEIFKKDHGFSPWPFVMTGQMTSEDAWEYKTSANESYARLDGQNQDKYRTIISKADERDTWRNAYDLNDDKDFEFMETYLEAIPDHEFIESLLEVT